MLFAARAGAAAFQVGAPMLRPTPAVVSRAAPAQIAMQTGTKSEVIGMIEAMRDAGVHQVAIQPIRPTREVVDQVAREIMPHFT